MSSRAGGQLWGRRAGVRRPMKLVVLQSVLGSTNVCALRSCLCSLVFENRHLQGLLNIDRSQHALSSIRSPDSTDSPSSSTNASTRRARRNFRTVDPTIDVGTRVWSRRVGGADAEPRTTTRDWAGGRARSPNETSPPNTIRTAIRLVVMVVAKVSAKAAACGSGRAHQKHCERSRPRIPNPNRIRNRLRMMSGR